MNTLMARQSILNANYEIYGFEFLYRGSRYDVSKSNDAMGATSELLSNLFTAIQNNEKTNNLPAFINIDSSLIESPSFFPSFSDNIILEILEDVVASPQIIARIRNLKQRGFKFALDDFIFEPDRFKFLPYVDIVKIDISAIPFENIKKSLPILQPYSLILLAEKVETEKEFEECLKLGFDLFQGYFFDKPELVKGVEVSPSKQVALNLITELLREDITINEISTLISCDPRLVIKMLLLVNSSYFSFSRKIENLREAIVMLGIKAVQQWVSLLLLASESKSPLEIFRVLLSRAKALEAFAEIRAIKNKDDYFYLGLFSGLHALIGTDLETLLEKINLNKELKAALKGEENSIGNKLLIIKAIERFDFNLDKFNSKDVELLMQTYWQGIEWADELMDKLIKEM
ncbi:HDOD domain-containing protein [Pseudoalteromonas sp. APAL1]|uniref:EAL and HDOD domain-containing protein n=1 Tax=Pseudoalteromonas sp. APAL1 TaxID=2908883 RepID=UPI001F47E37F|nr:HDOD domain-containing protein [Pseudoalteromonas sp. APAL1]MCF2922708.1 HDOD domain-containing protein [Pseudoalteromonas sp. APAL1]